MFFFVCGCGGGEDNAELLDAEEFFDEASGADEFSADETSHDGMPEIEAGEWVFDRDNYEIIVGWILLDSDPEAVKKNISDAKKYGVNHIQLSHGLIMDIDDVIGDSDEVKKRVETLNMGIKLAHENGMKAYVWTHEFSKTALDVCYSPESEVWELRADAYREGIEKIPEVDGIILMFGSAQTPPWYTFCLCEWCSENYEGTPVEIPPQDERIRLITEHVGGVIANELGKELFIRTFVHEPEEIEWHGKGLAAAKGVEFTGMHKGDVQDWQPYNPPDPNIGNVGNHPSVVELDLAGEYWGLSELPFCAPGYLWYRMKYMWENKGIGAVSRVERGAENALGTPNEINIYTVTEFLKDIDKPLEEIWDEAIEMLYGVSPQSEGQKILERILKDTFPIRLKSHYALGVWALEKGSGLPDSMKFGEFYDRGKMPKWDPDWQGIWDSLDKPDRQTVIRLWQEGTEAVVLAGNDLASFKENQGLLLPDDEKDLLFRLTHQALSSRAWRAVDLFIWSARAYSLHKDDAVLLKWAAWARKELEDVRNQMIAGGMEKVYVASPASIKTFLDNTASFDTKSAEPEMPDVFLFSPIYFVEEKSDSAVLKFSASQSAEIFLDYGLEIPDYGSTIKIGMVAAEKETDITLDNL
ncbi:MAG: hypothetical protein FJ088_06880, partial [Deltaproteobacteria bacterium]|nr:hypothetical protein [Deltaproteobacteria bacterium]